MAKRRKRRKWSDDEKRMICAQTRLPGISVAQVARRYDVNANQVFNWLKDPKFAAKRRVMNRRLVSCRSRLSSPSSRRRVAVADRGEMVVELACGHRLRIVGLV